MNPLEASAVCCQIVSPKTWAVCPPAAVHENALCSLLGDFIKKLFACFGEKQFLIVDFNTYSFGCCAIEDFPRSIPSLYVYENGLLSTHLSRT